MIRRDSHFSWSKLKNTLCLYEKEETAKVIPSLSKRARISETALTLENGKQFLDFLS